MSAKISAKSRAPNTRARAPLTATCGPISLLHRVRDRAAHFTHAGANLLCVTAARDLDLVCEEGEPSGPGELGGLSVETSMGSLDVTSRAYEPPVLARFALEISKALTVLDGEILVLLPGMSAAMQAKELLDGSALAWPAADRDRVSVSSLGMQGPPASDSVLPAAVVLVGLTPALDSDDSSLRDARAWLRSGAVAVAINPKLPSPRPVEMNDFEAAYCLMSYTVARTDTYKKDGNLYQEDAGSAVLWRKFPDRWRVLSDYGNTREWTLVDELRRGRARTRSTMLLPGVQKRQAAIDSTKQALGGGAGAGGGGGPSPSASSCATRWWRRAASAASARPTAMPSAW